MNDGGYLLDASALLALFFQEPGAARVAEVWSRSQISAVNFSEVIAKLADRKFEAGRIERIVQTFDLEVLAVDHALAIRAGELRSITRHLGFSLADRVCLATAEATGRIALTADSAWTKFDGAVTVELIR
jgi:PIN domain nuclease of toxin-antitoxin system